MNKVKISHGNHNRSGGGGLSRMLREHKARLYIIRRCVVMLLCCHD
ncbi:small polypeptide DEVIL 4-like [Lolium rigidum]|nr:small polypeptide DEVIL 4-like [Lolium rigidum]